MDARPHRPADPFRERYAYRIFDLDAAIFRRSRRRSRRPSVAGSAHSFGARLGAPAQASPPRAYGSPR
jgi:hypothetical protein